VNRKDARGGAGGACGLLHGPEGKRGIRQQPGGKPTLRAFANRALMIAFNGKTSKDGRWTSRWRLRIYDNNPRLGAPRRPRPKAGPQTGPDPHSACD